MVRYPNLCKNTPIIGRTCFFFLHFVFKERGPARALELTIHIMWRHGAPALVSIQGSPRYNKRANDYNTFRLHYDGTILKTLKLYTL